MELIILWYKSDQNVGLNQLINTLKMIFNMINIAITDQYRKLSMNFLILISV